MSNPFVRAGHCGRLVMALSTLAAVVSTAGAQQENRITGRVTDATDHVAIPAAQILIVGTTLGGTTSDSGTFNLRVPTDAKAMSVRRIGYLAQTVTITPGKSNYLVALEKDVLRLETQVVTGLSTTVASQNAANAVSVVTTQSVNQVPAPTLENSLEGKIPGAVIESNNGGAPGGGLQMQIRGVTSINGNANPLYVIDGVILDNNTINSDLNAINQSGGGTSPTGQRNVAGAPSPEDNDPNRVADLNPDDIESIEVLKGASASAIYGSKASAGVVVITTKKGTSGTPRWSLDGQVGHFAIMNTYPVRTFPTLASAQAWYNNDAAHNTTPSAIAAGNSFISGIYAGDLNPQTALFGNGTVSNQFNVSVSGTSGPTQYYLSALSKYDNGIELNTYYRKQAVRANVTEQFMPSLNVVANLQYVHDITQRGVTGNDNIGISPYNVFSYTPSFQNLNTKSAAGVWTVNPFGPANPFADAQDIQTPTTVSRFIGGGSVNWTPFHTQDHRVSVSLLGGADLASLSGLLYAPPQLQVEQVIASGLPGTSVSNTSTINFANASFNVAWEFTGLKPVDLTTSVGVASDRTQSSNPVTVGYNLLSGVNAPTAGTVQQNFFFKTQVNDQSFYGQEQVLALDNRLNLTVGVTAERSSVNGDVSKFFYYPHYAASYRIRQNFASFIDEIKLRAAYGQSGNLAPYGTKYTPFNPAQIDGVSAIEANQQLGDPQLKPETAQETEVGVDFTFFKSRAQFSATVYQKRLTNLLLQAGVAPSLGHSFLYENGGEFTNQGLELQLQATPLQLQNGFTWSANAGYFRNYSTVNSLPVPNFNAGSTFGFGVDYLGPGRSLTNLSNPNAVLPNGFPTQVGDFAPGWTLTLGNDFTWHGFRVFGLLDWSVGAYAINLTNLYFDTGPFLYSDSAVSAARLASYGGGNQTQYAEGASFFKVRELVISYNLPAKWITGLWSRFASARISLTGYNLWGIWHYSGLDPEVTAFGAQPLTRGVDVTPYPPARSYFLGLNLGF